MNHEQKWKRIEAIEAELIELGKRQIELRNEHARLLMTRATRRDKVPVAVAQADGPTNLTERTREGTTMGQAKRRGTFEQRQADAINRRHVDQEEADRRADLAYAERQRAGNWPRRRHHPLAVAMLMASTMGVMR